MVLAKKNHLQGISRHQLRIPSLKENKASLCLKTSLFIVKITAVVLGKKANYHNSYVILYIFTILHDYYSCNQSVTAVVTVPGEKEKKNQLKSPRTIYYFIHKIQKMHFFFLWYFSLHINHFSTSLCTLILSKSTLICARQCLHINHFLHFFQLQLPKELYPHLKHTHIHFSHLISLKFQSQF